MCCIMEGGMDRSRVSTIETQLNPLEDRNVF